MVTLAEALTEFEGASAEEALEMLMEYGDDLPPLSEDRLRTPVPSCCRVQECQTPVNLWVDVRQGIVRIEADVPEQSPTVRGFVALLVLSLSGARVDEIAAIPSDLLPALGLEKTLGMTRKRGFQGIVSRIKLAALSAS